MTSWRKILSWEIDRGGLEEAPRAGKRVRMLDGVDEGDRTWAGFVVRPGAEGDIINPLPDRTKSTIVEVLWDDYPHSGRDPNTGLSTGWYVELSDIEYI